MNAAQIHLALNHVPLFLSVIGGVILILGMIMKNQSYKTLSLYFLVGAALFTAPVFLTGEGTEEMVEKLAGVNEAAIEEHEEMAKIALIIILATGVLALAGFWLRKNAAMAKMVFMGALLMSLVSFGAMARTAHLGGLVRHTELQSGATATAGETENEGGDQAGKEPAKEDGKEEKDDD